MSLKYLQQKVLQPATKDELKLPYMLLLTDVGKSKVFLFANSCVTLAPQAEPSARAIHKICLLQKIVRKLNSVNVARKTLFKRCLTDF